MQGLTLAAFGVCAFQLIVTAASRAHQSILELAAMAVRRGAGAAGTGKGDAHRSWRPRRHAPWACRRYGLEQAACTSCSSLWQARGGPGEGWTPAQHLQTGSGWGGAVRSTAHVAPYGRRAATGGVGTHLPCPLAGSSPGPTWGKRRLRRLKLFLLGKVLLSLYSCTAVAVALR